MPPSSRTSPKSYSKVSNLITGCAAICTAQTTDNNMVNKNLIATSIYINGSVLADRNRTNYYKSFKSIFV